MVIRKTKISVPYRPRIEFEVHDRHTDTDYVPWTVASIVLSLLPTVSLKILAEPEGPFQCDAMPSYVQ